jgi:hypothetical protein
MKNILTIVFVGMLIWSTPAGAQKTYSLTVSVHKDVAELKRDEVEAILQRASQIMQSARCPVTFTLDGDVDRFDVPGLSGGNITSPDQRDAVHNVKANVKIVDTIKWCTRLSNFSGCGFPTNQPSGPPSISIILTRNQASLANLWAHEMGHRMGLSHRRGLDRTFLMTACAVESRSVKLSKKECRCFLDGPLSCGTPKIIGCSASSARKRSR